MQIGPIAVNLTKKVLMAAPEGAYLVSNCGESPLDPLIAETVLPRPEREEQWARIVRLKGNHRLCRIFLCKEDYQEWLECMLRSIGV